MNAFDMSNFKCSVCDSSYTSYKSLRRHAKNIHPKEELELLAPKLRETKTYEFSCNDCTARFNSDSNFKQHRKNVHNDTIIAAKYELKCPLCTTSLSKKELLEHFKSAHNIHLENETLTFSSFNEFQSWKKEFEKESNCTFIVERGCKRKLGEEIHYFKCHRSGIFKSESEGKRHIKIQGSKKINGYCPAHIEAVVYTDGKCQVKCVKTHVGHQNCLQHLFLTREERESIAIQIASKKPYDVILDEVRNSISPSGLKRRDMLTRQDLYNIEASFNLTTNAVYHKNDALSVEAWINEVKEQDNPCVLYYKLQNKICSKNVNLKIDDFLLIIANEAQLELLMKFGSDCICIDSTHGTNGYDFELVTLMILDDLRQGFPCAFLFTNRVDQEIIQIFLDVIKEKTGAISPKVFMSDMAETFFNAWSKIMNLPQFRLYCTWHVDRAWRKNLKKIKTVEKQIEVYKVLRTILVETDKNAFERMLNAAIEMFSNNEDLKEFSKYFTEQYLNKVDHWAYCYRVHSGLNTNMHIERMHRTIKHIYLHGRHNKRLDKAIQALMKFLRDKLVDRLIILNKGKLTSKLKILRARHKASLEVSTSKVTQESETGNFLVQSATTSEFYIVEKKCENCECKLICTECKECIHAFSCTCIDSSIRWNMCKHIHLVCKHLNEMALEKSINIDDKLEKEEFIPLNIDFSNAERNKETDSIISTIQQNSSKNTANSLAVEKENLKIKFNDIIETISCKEQLDVFNKFYASAGPILKAIEKSLVTEPAISTTCSSTSSNKKIQPQSFYSVKKFKGKSNKSITKPSEVESQKIAISLLQSNVTHD